MTVRYSISHYEAVAFLRTLEDESVDMAIADPPYSSGGAFRGDRMGATNSKYVGTNVDMRESRPDFDGDNRDQRSYVAWCHLWMSEVLRVLKPGRLLLTFTDWRQLPVTTDAVQAAGFVWRGIVPWDKGEGSRPQLGRYRSQAEYVVWASRGPMEYAGPVAPGVMHHVRHEEDRIHATGKPVPLVRDLLVLCPPDGVVLDPFMGGGTTGLAALATGRRFMGCEINRQIYEMASRRLAAANAPAPQTAPGQGVLFGGER